MIYKLSKNGGCFGSLKPMPFMTFADFGQVEKDLENLLAENLLEVLFEDNQLMTIFQERSRQAEADIYAINRSGDLVIFELKRSIAGGDAVHQLLRYCEVAAHWDYDKLQDMYSTWPNRAGRDANSTVVDLQSEHQSNFNLDVPLSRNIFNQRQRMIVVGSAGNDSLVSNIDYWRSNGIAIDFVPYRIYEIGDEQYFEFFSPPYDSHANPADRKGVLFDTCRTYIEDSIWYMCENGRVAAFGDQKHIVSYLGTGDTVFLYHKWEGIIAAGLVKSGIKQDTRRDAMYRDLEWLTPLPRRGHLKAMSAAQIKDVLGHNFFWARTIKTPYLRADEPDKLLAALQNHLDNA